MRIADVEIGNAYLTRVSGALVKVVVTQRVEPTSFSKTARFHVRREDDGKALDKSRTASALRPIDAPDPVAVKLIEGAKNARALEEVGSRAQAMVAWEDVKKAAAENDRPRMVALADQEIAAIEAELRAIAAGLGLAKKICKETA